MTYKSVHKFTHFFYKKCNRISIGENHCIYFQKNGRIISRGNNFNGQLGTITRSSKSEHFQHTITRHSSDDFVQQVVALDSSTFILNSIGDLISFGKNKHGMYRLIIYFLFKSHHSSLP